MNYSKILYCDTANGIGCRTVLFVSGCRNHCKECFNPMTWDFGFGHPFTEESSRKVIRSLEPPYIDGITIMGGEPMEPENQPGILELTTEIRNIHPDKTIWIYSGFTWEELTTKPSRANIPCTKDILRNVDVLVDGRFELEKRNIMLNFRGSENQRIIDVPASLRATGESPVLSRYM